ncbi:glycosyltransferase family 2 protein [Alteromonas lipolytica]|uniref:Dolichol-phosphate mannosyltransferase n=1 Tax=Alteromonas lipolytica TaxID=1856405 RepID=A0A1E8FC18_9ALTE|nr:glycosyltransferase family 2 protein [Alteromonas lipolytica]OFI33148.1 dolichol-phosphate mannosyltransferase [Alteromonas lipolytica]GGF62065.1 dolichol-phosphate mannosyltransferase [Alteromonas lipolytica]
MDISFVIPAKNEQGNIRPLVTEITQNVPNGITFEIIYVDDGSTDGTQNELRGLAQELPVCLRVVEHNSSQGQSTAIMTGVRYARYEWIVTLDADGQNDPSDIPSFINLAAQQPMGTDFCIAGYRKNRKDNAWKRLQSRIANRVRQRLLHDDTPDTGCGLKLIPRSTFLALPYFDHMHRFLPALVKRLGGRIFVVEVNHRDRHCGASNYTMLSRLGVGIVDLFGVIWLLRRAKCPQPQEVTDYE